MARDAGDAALQSATTDALVAAAAATTTAAASIPATAAADLSIAGCFLRAAHRVLWGSTSASVAGASSAGPRASAAFAAAWHGVWAN